MTAFREKPGWCGAHTCVEDVYASRTQQTHREGAGQAHYDAAMANGFRFALQSAAPFRPVAARQ